MEAEQVKPESTANVQVIPRILIGIAILTWDHRFA